MGGRSRPAPDGEHLAGEVVDLLQCMESPTPVDGNPSIKCGSGIRDHRGVVYPLYKPFFYPPRLIKPAKVPVILLSRRRVLELRVDSPIAAMVAS